ncbi:GNAT family N-acetyltransferase [Photobacterium angustum]|uniref:GNAT family N-acetyltransferase n=1 Tax=Photobacterium angustum TaxID=661 RepID=UPI001FCA2301|nr:GNAT family N-acetyltransferase [Photobacterium angustum]
MLLDDLCHKLKQQGYRCVELDVTFCNIGAIRFYQRYGFYQVSLSGSEALSQQYGLPLLLRLRYVLPTSTSSQTTNTNIIFLARLNNYKQCSNRHPSLFQLVVDAIAWEDKPRIQIRYIMICVASTVSLN